MRDLVERLRKQITVIYQVAVIGREREASVALSVGEAEDLLDHIEQLEQKLERAHSALAVCDIPVKRQRKRIEQLEALVDARLKDRLIMQESNVTAHKRIELLEGLLIELRINMNKRAVDSFDYEKGEYVINGDTINMLVLDIAERDKKIERLEAELKEAYAEIRRINEREGVKGR